jgi:hypothetical protein
VSKGPWKSKTGERRESEEVVAVKIETWKDRRVEARAKAKEQTDAARQGAIAALAHRSRQDAKQRGAKRYIGAPCERHDNSERYTSSGSCIFCALELRNARRGKPCIHGKLRGTRLPPHLRHMPAPRHSGKLGGATPVLLLDIEGS